MNLREELPRLPLEMLDVTGKWNLGHELVVPILYLLSRGHVWHRWTSSDKVKFKPAGVAGDGEDDEEEGTEDTAPAVHVMMTSSSPRCYEQKMNKK